MREGSPKPLPEKHARAILEHVHNAIKDPRGTSPNTRYNVNTSLDPADREIAEDANTVEVTLHLGGIRPNSLHAEVHLLLVKSRREPTPSEAENPWVLRQVAVTAGSGASYVYRGRELDQLGEGLIAALREYAEFVAK